MILVSLWDPKFAKCLLSKSCELRVRDTSVNSPIPLRFSAIRRLPVLRDSINTSLKDAMKARDEARVSTLRMVNAAIQSADIEAGGHKKPPLNEAEVLALMQKLIKQRHDAIE